MKPEPEPQRVVRTEAGPGLPSQSSFFPRDVVPGKCVCTEERLEDGSRINPWATGHFTYCAMFQPKCVDCGQSSGTHRWDCPFWDRNPELRPF